MHQIIHLLEYLEDSAARFPDKTAYADEKQSFTFGQLQQGARNGGSRLLQTIKPGSMATVLVDRTALTLAGFFCALEAGCCYVPLDNKMPEARLSDILQQVQPAAILYGPKDKALAEKLSAYAPIFDTEELLGAEEDPAALAAARESVLDVDPAYMIFTSGSTGKPKGILVSHRSIIDFTEWMTEACGITENCVLGNQAPFYFDLSCKDVYQTLKNGCSCYIIPKKDFMFPLLLVDFLNEHRVNTIIWATSAFRLAADSKVLAKKVPEFVNKAILGGEALQAAHVNVWKRALPGLQVINLYGPTEVTVDCTWYPLDRDFADGEPIPIGKACRNMQVLLLDDDLKPAAPGASGEICARGSGLALGYFKDWDKTDAAFIQNPLNPDYPDRIYRTGDIGRLGEDGNIYYLSRRDGQIKHMGYRIELGEVETALSAVAGVDSGICFFDEEKDLIVACVQSTDSAVDAAYLASEAAVRLPKYMLPGVWRLYKRLPSNANGKIDRVSLRQEYFSRQDE